MRDGGHHPGRQAHQPAHRRRQWRAATVQGVAARWGFWHMGAFSADYKRQFGELPSATRRQAGAAAG